MKSRNLKAVLGLLLVGGAAQAAGPLYLQETNPPRPYVWDTSKGPIPAWTDGGGAFTYGYDGVTPFITIAPMPISAFLPTRAPCTIARCPTVTPSSSTQGNPGSACSTQHS
mgnify:CR=1 FL=1